MRQVVGSRFSGAAIGIDRQPGAQVSGYGAVESDRGILRVMLIDKSPTSSKTVQFALKNFTPAPGAPLFRYSTGGTR